MQQILIEREALLASLLPWGQVNYGIDEGWIRAYPYQVEVSQGGTCDIEVRAANHTGEPLDWNVEAVLPPGWSAQNQPLAELSGEYTSDERVARIHVSIGVPAGLKPGSYPLALRVTWAGRYLGQVCHTLLQVY
jgi:hypothetical protein